MRTAPPHALTALVLGIAGCVASGGGGGAGGGPAPVQVSGGAVGATCPNDDQIGCAPGGKAKVRCKGGAWQDDGACKAGESCVETKSGDVVSATECTVPPTVNTGRARWCAKASACLQDVSFSECMSPPSNQLTKAAVAFLPLVEADEIMMLMVDGQSACIGAATSCEAVRACMRDGAPACGELGGGACKGSKALYCDQGAPVTVDCAKIGLPCQVFTATKGSAVACAKVAPCSAPKTFTCSGSTAKVCAPVSNSASLSFDIPCGMIGATCDPNGKYDDDPGVCVFPGGQSCESSTYQESCAGTVAVECKQGKVRKLDCAAIGQSCGTYQTTTGQPANAVTGATCTDQLACLGNTPINADAKVVVFCDGASGYRSYDCALAGMEFDGYKCKFPGAKTVP